MSRGVELESKGLGTGDAIADSTLESSLKAIIFCGGGGSEAH
ncbi:MAG: hypothetical protein AAGA01_12845 [Cyanobacteria bacterium P01_E01_bin.43]